MGGRGRKKRVVCIAHSRVVVVVVCTLFLFGCLFGCLLVVCLIDYLFLRCLYLKGVYLCNSCSVRKGINSLVVKEKAVSHSIEYYCLYESSSAQQSTRTRQKPLLLIANQKQQHNPNATSNMWSQVVRYVCVVKP